MDYTKILKKITQKYFFVNSNSNTIEFKIFFNKQNNHQGLTLKNLKFFIQGNEDYFKDRRHKNEDK